MSVPQIYIFAVLAATLSLFIWGRWRYDIVALMALLAVVLGSLIPAAKAFSGFGHPAVITVAAVLVISRAIQNSGLIGWLARGLGAFNRGPNFQTGAVVVLVGILSAFMLLCFWFAGPESAQDKILLLGTMCLACGLSAAGARAGLDAILRQHFPRWLTWMDARE